MSHARYFVLRVRDRWRVTLEGCTMTHYATRTEAIESAIVMADLMGSMHHDSDVMVEMGPGLPLELVWTFGSTDRTPRARKATEPEVVEIQPHVRLVQRGGVAA
jgi:hypothetical protein